MKQLAFTVVMIFLFTYPVAAQEEPKTLLGTSHDKVTTFYWGPDLKWHFHGSRMEETVSPVLGASLGVIVNRKVILGIGGWGKVTRTSFYGHYIGKNDGQIIDNPHQKMAVGYGYGGLVLGVVCKSNRSVHATFTSVFGVGSSNEYVIESDGDHGTTFNSPGFGIIEPMLNMEMNLTRQLRVHVGLGYRWIAARRFEQLSSGDLSGLSLQTAIKIGRY
ncbi:hypothetical protein [Longitalea luteola]|uniref:hypothetical protein n=1 Tax=Longitalea luteola TaxID=2812563 RepID=UPI001A967B13|nr:hypothetical protein [Longitalea luteola]